MKRRFTVFILCFSLIASLSTIGSSAKYFTDVSSTSEYLDAINYVSDNGYMGGASSTEFSPTGNMNRAMFATVLYRYSTDKSINENKQFTFTDVPTTAWYYDAVRWAHNRGYMGGTSATTFSPTANITRQDAATVLYRYAGMPYSDGALLMGSWITDCNNVPDYARPAILWAAAEKVMSLNIRHFRPTSLLTRQEMAEAITQYGVFVERLNFTRDVYNFTNSPLEFNPTSDPNASYLQVGASFYNYLRLLLQPEYGNGVDAVLAKFVDYAADSGASCFGMSVTAALDKLGKLDVNGTTSNADNLRALEKPSENELLRNLINFYQVSQEFTHLFVNNNNKDLDINPTTMQSLLNGLDANGLVVCGFDDFGGLFHAVLAYGYDPSNTDNDGRYVINIYDPSFPNGGSYISISSDLDSMYYNVVREDEAGNEVISFTECMVCTLLTDFDNFDVIDMDGDFNDSLPVYLYTDNLSMVQMPLSDSISANEYENWDSVISPLYEKANLNFSSDSYFELTNSKGETLIYDKGEFGGTMEVYSSWLICGGEGRISCLVDESELFVCERLGGNTYFSVLQGDDYVRVKGEGIRSITVIGDEMLVDGENFSYDMAVFCEKQNALICDTGKSNNSVVFSDTSIVVND